MITIRPREPQVRHARAASPVLLPETLAIAGHDGRPQDVLRLPREALRAELSDEAATSGIKADEQVTAVGARLGRLARETDHRRLRAGADPLGKPTGRGLVAEAVDPDAREAGEGQGPDEGARREVLDLRLPVPISADDRAPAPPERAGVDVGSAMVVDRHARERALDGHPGVRKLEHPGPDRQARLHARDERAIDVELARVVVVGEAQPPGAGLVEHDEKEQQQRRSANERGGDAEPVDRPTLQALDGEPRREEAEEGDEDDDPVVGANVGRNEQTEEGPQATHLGHQQGHEGERRRRREPRALPSGEPGGGADGVEEQSQEAEGAHRSQPPHGVLGLTGEAGPVRRPGQRPPRRERMVRDRDEEVADLQGQQIRVPDLLVQQLRVLPVLMPVEEAGDEASGGAEQDEKSARRGEFESREAPSAQPAEGAGGRQQHA